MTSSLTNGNTKSCGCNRKETASKKCDNRFIGKKFGRLTVIKRVDDRIQPNGNHNTMLECQCDCGNITVVRASDLTNNHTQSCGCFNKERVIETSLIDLTGERFGRLTVVKRAESRILSSGKHVTRWLCKCDCGNETIVNGGLLQSGQTQSCGCYNKERISETSLHNLTGMKFGKLTVIERGNNRIESTGKNRVMWKCKCDCGNETIVASSSLVTGLTQSCGCMKSHGEYYISTYLLFNNINFENQKRFSDLLGVGGGNLSYDFYLPNHNMLIECQGEQHFKPYKIFGGEEQFAIQQEHDRRKREYAKDNGYRLLEISYKDYNNIDNILTKAIN